MSELAFNYNGEPFEVPAVATGWRVRRMKQKGEKGAPEVVYGRSGQPLVLPIEAGLDDLKAEVDASGRYRLDPVDDHGKAIVSSPSGYVHVTLDAPEPAEAPVSPQQSFVVEAMRLNAEIARAVIERFPLMMDAAATLLRAADGAGLPARPGMASPERDEDDDEDASETRGGGGDFATLAAQIAPALLVALSGDRSKLPSLSEMLDWRKAAASGRATRAGLPAAEREVSAASSPAELMTRVAPVLAQLTAEERALAIAMAQELSPDERAQWLAELAPLSTDDAVARIRQLLDGDHPEKKR